MINDYDYISGYDIRLDMMKTLNSKYTDGMYGHIHAFLPRHLSILCVTTWNKQCPIAAVEIAWKMAILVCFPINGLLIFHGIYWEYASHNGDIGNIPVTLGNIKLVKWCYKRISMYIDGFFISRNLMKQCVDEFELL